VSAVRDFKTVRKGRGANVADDLEALGLREKGLRLKRLFLTTPRDLYKTCFKRQANSRYVSIVKYYGAREGLKENGPVW
jgi:hypothetical protein